MFLSMRAYRLMALAFIVALILGVALLSLSAPAGASTAPRWSCAAQPWVVGSRLPEWSGDTAGAASGLPDGTLAVASYDVSARTIRLWLYSENGGDTIIKVPFGDLQWEPGTSFPTGRIDTVGIPVVLYQGQVKLLFKSWNGGGNGPAPLGRIYTWCKLE